MFSCRGKIHTIYSILTTKIFLSRQFLILFSLWKLFSYLQCYKKVKNLLKNWKNLLENFLREGWGSLQIFEEGGWGMFEFLTFDRADTGVGVGCIDLVRCL